MAPARCATHCARPRPPLCNPSVLPAPAQLRASELLIQVACNGGRRFMLQLLYMPGVGPPLAGVGRDGA